MLVLRTDITVSRVASSTHRRGKHKEHADCRVRLTSQILARTNSPDESQMRRRMAFAMEMVKLLFHVSSLRGLTLLKVFVNQYRLRRMLEVRHDPTRNVGDGGDGGLSRNKCLQLGPSGRRKKASLLPPS